MSEPDKIFDMYYNLIKFPRFLGLILGLGSLAFPLALPLFVSQIIDTVKEKDGVSIEDFEPMRNNIILALSISLVCTWLERYLFIFYGHLLSKKMRFDMYVVYFDKVRDAKGKNDGVVDEMQSSK